MEKAKLKPLFPPRERTRKHFAAGLRDVRGPAVEETPATELGTWEAGGRPGIRQGMREKS